MKKLILSVAIASMSLTAAAQSNVTIYGTVDAGVAYSDTNSKVGPTTKSGVYSGLWDQSLIGFKGSENLGNGMKAIFQLEYAIDVSQGSGIDNAREQSLGLETQVGTFKFGRLETAGSLYQKKYDAMEKTAFSPLTTLNNQETFLNSTAAYQGSFGGFELGGSYSFDGTGNSTLPYGSSVDQEKIYSANVGFNTKAFGVGYVYTNVDNLARTANGLENHLLGGYVALGGVKVTGAYSQTKDDNNTVDSQLYVAGVQLPLSANMKVDASYGRAEDDITNGDANIYGVQLSYNMSRRTMLYTGYQYVDNNKTSYAALGNTYGSVGNGTSQGVGVGMKHSF